MIVVFDANVAVTLSLPRSQSSRLYDRLLEMGHEIAISPRIFAEVKEKMLHKASLRAWLCMSDEEIDAFLIRLPKITTVTEGIVEIEGVVRNDPKDDHIVAAAIESKATFIVTEDKHLLQINFWRGIRIVDRQTLLAELDDTDNGSTGT